MAPAYVTGQEAGTRLLKALGLEGRAVTELTLRVRIDDLVRVEFRELLAPGVSSTTGENTTPGQADALVAELTAINSSNWREFVAGRTVSRDRVLESEGDAERLARAVLRGDWQSAIPLADLVQESWAERFRQRKGT